MPQRTPKFPKVPESFSNLPKIPQSTSKQRPLSKVSQNSPRYPKVLHNTPKFPQTTPKLPQTIPKYPKIPQSTPEYPQSTRKVPAKYPKVSQNTPKYPKVTQSAVNLHQNNLGFKYQNLDMKAMVTCCRAKPRPHKWHTWSLIFSWSTLIWLSKDTFFFKHFPHLSQVWISGILWSTFKCIFSTGPLAHFESQLIHGNLNASPITRTSLDMDRSLKLPLFL